MQVVVLASDPADGNPRLWRDGLRAAGAQATIVTGAPRGLPRADLVIGQLLGRPPSPLPSAWRTAERYERAGVPLLNSTACLHRSADKWRTHRAWGAAGLRQPRTWRLVELADRWPAGPVLVKPACGESARGIVVVADRAAARAIAGPWEDEALVQEVIPCRSVLRVHATRDRVVGAFARPAAVIAGLLAPDPSERRVRVNPELEALATAGVRALDGGLVGLDVIESPGGPMLLEANPPFSMPGHLPDYLAEIVETALRTGDRSPVLL